MRNNGELDEIDSIQAITAPNEVILNAERNLPINADFLNFIERYFSVSSPTIIENFAFYTGAMVGCFSTALAFPYGYMLGSENLGIDSPIGKKIVGGYIAITATATLCVLTARVTANTWQVIVRGRSEEEILITRKFNFSSTDPIKFVSFNVLPIVMAVISTAPNILLTEKGFRDYSEVLAITLSSFAFLGISTLRTWALNTILKRVFNELKFGLLNFLLDNGRLKKCGDLYKHTVVRNNLLECRSMVMSLSTYDADNIKECLFTPSNTAADISKKITLFMDLLLEVECTEAPRFTESWGSYIFRNTGSLMACIYPYAAYVLGYEASKDIWRLFGVDNNEFNKISAIFLGVTSYLSVMAIGSIANNDTFKKFYGLFSWIVDNLIQSKEAAPKEPFFEKRRIVNALFYVVFSILALSSTAPKTKISIDTVNIDFYGILVIATTIISVFSTDFWSWTSFKEEKLSKPNSQQTVIKLIDGFIDKLDIINDDCMNDLFKIVLSKNSIGRKSYGTTLERPSINSSLPISLNDVDACIAPIDTSEISDARLTEQKSLLSAGFFGSKRKGVPRHNKDDDIQEIFASKKPWSCSIL